MIMESRLIHLKLLIALCVFTLSSLNSFGITYYSRLNGGLWTSNNTWSTVNYTSTTNTGTYPKIGDFVMIGNGFTVYINNNVSCSGLSIGQGLSGSLLFSPAGNFTLNVAGNTRIFAGAQLSYNSILARTHQFITTGSIANSGAIDFFVSPSAIVNSTFYGSTSSTVSGVGVFDLNIVTLDKSTSINNFLKASTATFESGTRNLVLNYGTFIHDNTSSYSVNPLSGNFTIGPDVIVQVPKGTMNFSPNSASLYLQGKLQVNGGTVNVGDAAGTGGIRYNRLGTNIPELCLSAGIVNIFGGFCNRFGYTADAARVMITNGTINLNTGSTGTANSLFQINSSAQSNFTMSNGTIVLSKPNTTGAANSDFNINGAGGTVNVSGGTIQFGDNSTPTNAIFNFTPYAGIVMPNFKITGQASRAVTLFTSKNSTSDFKLISLFIDQGKTFDVKPIAGSTGFAKSMTLVGNYDGMHAFYNDGIFSEQNSTVIMEANEGQWIAGNTLTTFYNFKINNPFGVSLGKSMNVSNALELFNGIIYSNPSNYITCLPTSNNSLGSSSSYIEGPIAHIVATTSAKSINIPIGKNGAYRPMNLNVHHTSMIPVTYLSEVQPYSAVLLAYMLPPSLELVSDVRYFTINRTNVPNLQSAAITLSYGTDDFVTDFASLRVARDNGSNGWIDLGGIGTGNGTGTITSNGFTGFNTIFTLANARDGRNPLPVQAVDLSLTKSKSAIELGWTLIDYSNIDKYEVYRSDDALNFNLIQQLDNVSMGMFNTYDNQPIDGFNYYYVKAFTRDGDVIISNTKSIRWTNEVITSLYPNPSYNNNLQIQLDNIEISQVNIRITTITGQVVYQDNLSLNNGYLAINASELNAGTYTVNVADENQTYLTKQWILVK